MEKRLARILPAILIGLLIAFFIFKTNNPEGTFESYEAKELAIPNANGEVLKLSDLKGNVVLIDFWASWCAPCRRENKNLVKTYAEYKDADFKDGGTFIVYSVSLDEKRAAWLKAIEKDKLVWDTHVSDLLGWNSPAAAIYDVDGIPDNFLVNQDGEVIASNLRGVQLDAALKKLTK